MNKFLTWFQQKTANEQKILVITTLIACLLILYAFIYLPITRDNETLRSRISSYQQDLTTMHTMAEQIKHLSQTNNRANPKKALSSTRLMTLIEQTARQQKLNITQIKPLSQKRLQIILNDAIFNSAVRWLNSLTTHHAININKITSNTHKDNLNLQVTLSY